MIREGVPTAITNQTGANWSVTQVDHRELMTDLPLYKP